MAEHATHHTHVDTADSVPYLASRRPFQSAAWAIPHVLLAVTALAEEGLQFALQAETWPRAGHLSQLEAQGDDWELLHCLTNMSALTEQGQVGMAHHQLRQAQQLLTGTRPVQWMRGVNQHMMIQPAESCLIEREIQQLYHSCVYQIRMFAFTMKILITALGLG